MMCYVYDVYDVSMMCLGYSRRNDMLSMKNDSGVIFINDKSRNIGDLMH